MLVGRYLLVCLPLQILLLVIILKAVAFSTVLPTHAHNLRMQLHWLTVQRWARGMVKVSGGGRKHR